MTMVNSGLKGLTLRALTYSILFFSLLKLCLATAIHNFKRLKMHVIFLNLNPNIYQCFKIEADLFLIEGIFICEQLVIRGHTGGNKKHRMSTVVDISNKYLLCSKG